MDDAKKSTFKYHDLSKRSFYVFDDMRNAKEFCDITFRIGNETISAHRIIVMAAIPYFRELLSKKTAEERKEKGISVSYIEPKALRCLIEFAYCFEVKINMDNVFNLLSAACFLRVVDVREACCDFLADSLNPGNVLSIRQTACNLHCSELLKIVDCYVREHFYEISKTKDFLDCSFNYLKYLIGKDDLNVDNEEKVFEAVLYWVKSSPEDRKIHLQELLPRVRLALLKPLQLTSIVEKQGLIRTSVSCRDLIDEAKNCNLFPEKTKMSCSSAIKPRNFLKAACEDTQNDEKRLYMLESKLIYSIQHTDFIHGKWLTEESKTFLLNSGSVVGLHNHIYSFDRGVLLQYNPERNVYKHCKEVTFPRSFPGVVSFKNKVFICGGRANGIATNVVQYFELEKEVWKNVNCMHTSRWSPSAAALGEYVFILGGRDNYALCDYVERYDSLSGKWSIMASMLTKRCSSGSATLNGNIYVCGGYALTSDINCVATVEVYDPCENKWKVVSSMNAARCEFTLLPYCGKLYALGGKDDSGKRLHSVEIYDPESDEWTFGTPTDPNHAISGAVLISNPTF